MMTGDQRKRLKAAYEAFSKRAAIEDPEGKEEVDALLRLVQERTHSRETARSVFSSVQPMGLDHGDGIVGDEDLDLADLPELLDVWDALQRETPEDEPEGAVSALGGTVDGPAHEHFRRHRLPPSADEEIEVLPDGGLLGSGRYQILDPNWIEGAIEWLTHLFDRVEFNTAAPVVRIPNDTSMALLGDWGTGFYAEGCGSENVRDVVAALEVDYTVHLGDVYYAGTRQEVRERFLANWPVGTRGSFALNSNHEMYSGGKGLFQETFLHEAFRAQERASFFALENDHWVIVALDSAYHAKRYKLYRTGRLDDDQLRFLADRVDELEGRGLILMSHHQGLELDGRPTRKLWRQVRDALRGQPATWYWGHLHTAVVYAEQEGVRGRCNGHGGIPRGRAQVLDDNDRVLWFEERTAGDVSVPPRVVNGLAVLELSGSELRESFLDEQGRRLWQSRGPTGDL